MPGMGGVASMLLGAALLLGFFGETGFGGLSPVEASLLLALGAVTLIMAGTVVDGFARHWTHGVQAVAVSGGILMALFVIYGSRDELHAVIDRAIGDVSAGRTVSTPAGEAVAARRSDGSFIVTGQVNGKEARFVFDTGASTVVLRGENAAALGFDPASLRYAMPVSTANGTALAAAVTIERLTVGPITQRNVRALIARPGTLHANLLGMSFLERLGSYEVRGNRLILRAEATTVPPGGTRMP